MSRQIDTTKPLSAEDREYMLTRGREDEVARLDAQFGTEVDSYDEDEEPYDKWKVEELRDEANLRKLTVKPDAKKADLIKALEDDDKTAK